ncbi:unnamed protein product [Phytophthora fragariaefolia]|uniref:Unnamed protein product n=1 Tax=Phytophthora fragariaefolia TaxID=1490495 RepID=A0A9W7CIV2_9STRA|nr:unnamed protein product [Phytophthora fragariaefolia]
MPSVAWEAAQNATAGDTAMTGTEPAGEFSTTTVADDQPPSTEVIADENGAVTVSEAAAATTGKAAAAATSCGVASGGFTFFNVAGSGAVLTSGIGTVPSVASVATAPATIAASANVTQVWPTIPAVSPPVAPSAGAFSATELMMPQYSGGGFGKKLDNKPPVMQGSFDLYAVQLKTFLTRLNVWCIVENAIAVRASVTDEQFAMMDNIARGAILHGVQTADAELICHKASAQEMWTSFVNKQTKREYANYIFARQRLYANKYVPERNMNDWLREMQLLRNELLHYMKIISDEEFAEILLSNVAQTHREVVRQFSKHYDPGFQRNTPSSAQVMNAIRAESELDERSDEPSGSQDISSAQSAKGSRGKQQDQPSDKNKKRGKGDIRAKAKRIAADLRETKVERKIMVKIPVNAGTATRLDTFRLIVHLCGERMMKQIQLFLSGSGSRIRKLAENLMGMQGMLICFRIKTLIRS